MKWPARREDNKQLTTGVRGSAERLISADGDISGIASSGDHALNVQFRSGQMTALPAEAFRPVTDLTAPSGLASLPGCPTLFVGRDAELARLDEAMTKPGGVVVHAVHGLGGIGKSTLAAYWAATHADRHTLTWWITADTPASIDAGLAALGAALQPALSAALPTEVLSQQAVQWLSANPGWLLILDNVSDPADVAPLLASAPRGRYLITSRRATGWHDIALPLRLGVLSEAEAVDLMCRILTHDRPRELEGAAGLCQAGMPAAGYRAGWCVCR